MRAATALHVLQQSCSNPKHVPRICGRCLHGATRAGSERANGFSERLSRTAGAKTAWRAEGHCLPKVTRKSLATMADYRKDEYGAKGPIAEYDSRVASARLRNDEHQRNLITALQDLHVMLRSYDFPDVVQPSIESLQPRKGLFSSLFGMTPAAADLTIPESLPKGLYMYGDVGSGKTMLMDLFYDTLPSNIRRKVRIHFHNFMQDVHKRLHAVKMQHGLNVDAVALVAAQIAADATVLCFDEFQCTDVADAMILRRLIQALMHHGTVLVTTSNRHPRDLYKNGIQRESFLPCIALLLHHLRVLNLDSTTDYRKIPRPPSGVYHHPLDAAAQSHADHWFRFLGDPQHDPPHPASIQVWGRQVHVPLASGSCAKFTFKELLGGATGAADYIALVREYASFVVTDVPAMNLRSRDLARRFITFVDAVYEGRGKLVLTSEKGLGELFVSRDEIGEALLAGPHKEVLGKSEDEAEGGDVEGNARKLKRAMPEGVEDEETFAFARALSRLSEMGSQEWVERGLGLENKGGKEEAEGWRRVRSKWREDAM